MDLGNTDVHDGCGVYRGAAELAPPCSICFEAVINDGVRSTAKLQCGHEFHLDCIGSAFNAKGMMQCPNCRTVEKGNWLYGNGFYFLPAFNVDEWTHDEDFNDFNYLEMPYGAHWCPVSRIERITSSLENGGSFPSVPCKSKDSVYFGIQDVKTWTNFLSNTNSAVQDPAGHHIIFFTEFPSISAFTEPCSHLSGFVRAQTTPAPFFSVPSAGFSESSSYYRPWGPQDVNFTGAPSPLSLSTNGALYNGWDQYQSTHSQPRDISQAYFLHAPLPSSRLEDGGPHRTGAFFYSFIGRHGSHAPSPSLLLPHRNRQLHNISGEHSIISYGDVLQPGNSLVSLNGSSKRDMINSGGHLRRQLIPFASAPSANSNGEYGLF